MEATSRKVVLVTGGGEGIGKAACRRFFTDGLAVAILGRSPDNIREVEKELTDAGGDARAITADISDDSAMENAIREIRERWGRLDVVFAHAGINGVWAPLTELAPEEWEKTIRINLTGTYLTLRHAVPLMQERGGSIIITSSVNGTRMFSNTGASAYSASKAGQVALMKMLALELAKYRIRVNAICPGTIESQIQDNTEPRDIGQEKEPVEFPEGAIPLTDGAAGSAESVADLVAFLASEKARHITGTEVFIDGAQSLLVG